MTTLPGPNLLANIVGQVATGVVAILSLPWLLGAMGSEGFAIVAFFVAMQAWFTVLDIGLGTVLSRATARRRAGTADRARYGALYSAIGRVFAAASAVAVGLGLVTAPWLAGTWLSADGIESETLTTAVRLMVVAVALRWAASFYRMVLAGHERFVFIGSASAVLACLRFALVVPMLSQADPGSRIVWFMAWQSVLSLFELLAFRLVTLRLRPPDSDHVDRGSRWAALRLEAPLAGTIALSTLLWLLVSQSDRVLLPAVLTLSEYGVFAVAVTLAGAVLMVSQPIIQLAIPRLSRLVAAGSGSQSEYFSATATLVWLCAPIAVGLAACAAPLLRWWTGDAAMADTAAPALVWYSVGNLALAISTMVYPLQLAHGDLRLQVLLQILRVVAIVPTQLWAASVGGIIGAGVAWAAVQMLSFLLITFLVHRRFLPGRHWAWLAGSVLLPSATIASLVVAGRAAAGLLAGGSDLVIVLTTAGASLAAAGLGIRRMMPWFLGNRSTPSTM